MLAVTFSFEFTGCDQFPQSALNGTVADRGTEFADILLVESPDFVFASPAHHFERGQLRFHKGKPGVCGNDALIALELCVLCTFAL